MRGKYQLIDKQPNRQIGDPVPGEHTLHSNHNVLPERSDDAQGIGGDVGSKTTLE